MSFPKSPFRSAMTTTDKYCEDLWSLEAKDRLEYPSDAIIGVDWAIEMAERNGWSYTFYNEGVVFFTTLNDPYFNHELLKAIGAGQIAMNAKVGILGLCEIDRRPSNHTLEQILNAIDIFMR